MKDPVKCNIWNKEDNS